MKNKAVKGIIEICWHYQMVIVSGIIIAMVFGILYFFYGVKRDYVFSDTLEPNHRYHKYYHIDKHIYDYGFKWKYYEPELQPHDTVPHTCIFRAYTLKAQLPFNNNEGALKALNKKNRVELEIPIVNGRDVFIKSDEQSAESKWFPRNRLTNELFNPYGATQKEMEAYYDPFLIRDKAGNIIPTTQNPIMRELPECERQVEEGFMQRLDPDPVYRKLWQRYVFQLRNTHQEELKKLVKIISDKDTIVKLELSCTYNTEILFYSLRKKILLAYRISIPYLQYRDNCPMVYSK